MRKIRNIPRYKFPCQRFLWLPYRAIFITGFPLKTGGDRAVFRTLLAVFRTGCVQVGLPTPAKVRGGAGAWQRRKAGYQLHGVKVELPD